MESHMRSGMAFKEDDLTAAPCWEGAKAAAEPARRDAVTRFIIVFVICFLEFCTSAAVVEVSKGESDREAGDFQLDPLQFLKDKSKEEVDLMKLKELQNGRLAMLAFAGVATQAGLGGTEFPYLVPYPLTEAVTW